MADFIIKQETVTQSGCSLVFLNSQGGGRHKGSFQGEWEIQASKLGQGHLNGCSSQQCPTGSTISWSSGLTWTRK